MKYSCKWMVFVASFFVAGHTVAQNPIHWEYTSIKTGAESYEIHVTATLDKGWHTYSQVQPKSAVAVPTAIKFSTNPLVKIIGKPTEIGSMVKWSDPVTEIAAYQYSEKVDFIQKITLKGSVKTSLKGTLTYETCTDEMCLPAKTVNFNIPLP